MTYEQAIATIENKLQAIKYPAQAAELYEPIAYLLALKGKKVRPALTLLACNLYQEDIEKAVDMALAWEIFHNFTLMHDDVMDQADVRRGQPTVHKKWDENTAILSGDAMLILAYQYVAKTGAHPEQGVCDTSLRELLDLFSTTAAEICEGQQLDMAFENRLDVQEAEYLNMIRLKTAVLLGASLKSGAIIGGANAQDAELMYDFGVNLGVAFQIQDDLLDVYGDAAVFGKKIGGDILANKKTYLSVNALNTTDAILKKSYLLWLEYNAGEATKIDNVTTIYNRLGLKEKARQAMDSYFQKALKALEQVNVPAEKKSVLKQLATDLMNRNS
ncbi:MAG: polyprenyl synthetase family protein [Candidatus Symbiothrix sp.]|jgi:geranylgeranyl diphosphate synthase type II|nr:polyprenyl synthetase family protein [Candidatus Symbiothrix sp.]